MVTTSLDLLVLVHAALVGATDAQNRVYRPGDWPTQDSQYPITKLRIVRELRQSLGNSGPAQYRTTLTIRVSSEVSAPAKLDDAGATEAEAALWQLKRQNEVAIVNSSPLEQQIEQIISIDSQLAFNSDAATHLAGIQTDLTVQFYEGPESFAPVDADDVDELHLTASDYSPAGFVADLT